MSILKIHSTKSIKVTSFIFAHKHDQYVSKHCWNFDRYTCTEWWEITNLYCCMSSLPWFTLKVHIIPLFATFYWKNKQCYSAIYCGISGTRDRSYYCTSISRFNIKLFYLSLWNHKIHTNDTTSIQLCVFLSREVFIDYCYTTMDLFVILECFWCIL